MKIHIFAQCPLCGSKMQVNSTGSDGRRLVVCDNEECPRFGWVSEISVLTGDILKMTPPGEVPPLQHVGPLSPDEVNQMVKDFERSQNKQPLPVDRSKQCMISGRTVAEAEADNYRELRSDGQQKDYVILCAYERSRGFVRPVRRTYRHVGVRPKYSTRELTAEEKERYSDCNYVLFETYPPEVHHATGRYWTAEQLHSGCGHASTMNQAIAETYARDPKFYGATFCCTCGVHRPLEEFIWEGTNEQVGS